MWDSRYIPTVECSGEHPDSQSCPYGGTSTPQPSSPSPSSTPSPSPNPTPTPPAEGKRGSKTREIFTFRKQSWGGGHGELVQPSFGSILWIPELFADLWLLSLHSPRFLFHYRNVDFFVTWSFPVVHCGAMPYQNVISNVDWICDEGGSPFDRLEVKGLLSPWSRMDNHQPLCWSGASSGFRLLLVWQTSMGFVGSGSHKGLRQPARVLSDSDHGSNQTGDSFTGLELEVLKMLLCSHKGIFVWILNHIMCISPVGQNRTFLTWKTNPWCWQRNVNPEIGLMTNYWNI